jgi:biopolymer transport protein ExbD
MPFHLGLRLALLAILGTSAFIEWKHFARPTPTGSYVYLPHVCSQEEADNRGDGREVWIRLYPGQTYMNDEPITRDQIANVTGRAMDSRAEPLVNLLADGQLSYGEVVTWVSRMQARSPGLIVLLITKSQDEASKPFHCVVLSMKEFIKSQPASDSLSTKPVR